METYFPIIIALISSLVGIFGDIWVKDNTAKKELSTKGKLVLTIALISFFVSIRQKSEDEEKITQLELAKKNFNLLAQKNLKEAIKECVNPIYQFGKPTASFDTLTIYEDLPNQIKIDTIYKIEFWKRIRRKNLFSSMSTVKSWGLYMNERCSLSKQIFEDVLNKHGAYLKIKTISQINDVLDDEVFKSLLHRTGNMKAMNVIWNNELEFFIAIGMKEGDSYQKFINKLADLQK